MYKLSSQRKQEYNVTWTIGKHKEHEFPCYDKGKHVEPGAWNVSRFIKIPWEPPLDILRGEIIPTWKPLLNG